MNTKNLLSLVNSIGVGVFFQRLLSIGTNPRYLAALFLIIGVGAFAGLRMIIVNAYTILYPIALIVASTISLLALYRLEPSATRLSAFTTPSVSTKVFVSVYLFLGSACLYLYHLSGFGRGPGVYVLTLMMYLVSIFSVVLLRNWLIPLLFVVGTAIFHRATVYFTSPYTFGVDPHGHYDWAIDISALGSLDPLSATKYYFAPLYHIQGAIGSIVLDIDVQDGVMFSVMIIPIVIVSALLIFSLLMHYWGWQIALIGPLLFLSSGHAIGGMLSLGPTELSLLFFVQGFYSVVCYLLDGEKRWLVLSILTFGALTFTHQASTFIAILVVSVFILIFAVVTKKLSRSFNIILILGTVLVFDWTTTKSGGVEGGPDFFTSLLGNALRSLMTQIGLMSEETGARPEGQLPPDPAITPTGMFASMTEVHVLGGAVLFGLGIIGILWWLYTVSGSEYQWISLAIGGSTAVLLGLMMGGPLIGFSFFAPGRWFMYVYFLLSIFAAIGLVVTVQLVSESISKTGVTPALLLCVLCLVFVGVMGGNAYGSIDDPIFDAAPGADRNAFTEQEVHKVEHAEQYLGDNAEIYTDRRIQPLISRYSESTVAGTILRVDYQTGELRYWAWADNRENYLLLRHEMVDETMYDLHYNDRYYRVYGPIRVSDESLMDYNLVYTSERDTCEVGRCGLYHQR
ncbi:hypothetical protein ACLI4U_13440 [Natrialbaceae archaeon A-CW2]